MDIDSTPDPSSTPAEDRRKSGRATRRPDVFSQSTHSTQEQLSGGKRKRGDAPGTEDSDNASSESESDDGMDDDADEEELRAKRRAARKAAPKKAQTKKRSHAAKKPKFASNGLGRQLAFRPALNGKLPSARPRTKPKVRPSLAAGERGIYGE